MVSSFLVAMWNNQQYRSEFMRRGNMTQLKRALIITMSLVLMATLAVALSPTSTQVHAQSKVESDDLAKFVALMQYIRSTPTPSDVKASNIPLLSSLDTAFSDIYITGFITPYTGETSEQVKARLQSVPEEDRFTAVMVESYRLSPDPLLLNIVHQLLPLYYVQFFTTAADLNASDEFLKRNDIESLAATFDSTGYVIPAPSATGTTSSSDRGPSNVNSDDLAKFVAVMQYIRSQPTPSNVKANNIPLLSALDTAFSDIYITGFITPYTGETPDQVKARLQSVPADDRFTAVMVESYRLSPNPLLLNIVHQLLPLYYVQFFTTAEDLNASAEFLKRNDIESLAATFDSTGYAIPAASAAQTPTATTTPSVTPVASATPTIAEMVRNVQGGVVQIIALTGSGSGFVIDADGRVVTNQHVVSGNQSVTVRMNDGTEYHASVLGVDPVADLAVVDIAPEIALTPVPLGDSSIVQVGEEVIAIGYPLGFQLGQSQTVTQGIISARRPNFEGTGVEHFQTDAAINPGNSGGPLFNRSGQVIGVNTSKREYTPDGRPVDNIAFAVSINELKSRLDTLKGSGSPQPVTTPTTVPTPATPVPTPSAAPTPPPLQIGWNRYNNGVYGFSIDTPPSWTLDEDSEEWNFAFFASPDGRSDVTINALDLPSSLSLQRFAELNRDWWINIARDESWNVFQITSFGRKQEGGKEFYELVFQRQRSTTICVEHSTERIYLSSWYPGKPHGFTVETSVCEDSRNRYATDNRAIQDSFTEWLPYWNPTHAWGLNAAPGWILDEETNSENYSAFWTTDKQGIFEVEAFEVGASETLEDFTNWRIDVLNRLSKSWDVFEPVGGPIGLGGVPGAREGYLISYVAQTDSEHCVAGNVELLVLSSYHPEHEYGFLVVTGVCGPVDGLYDRYDDERWEMIYSFRY